MNNTNQMGERIIEPRDKMKKIWVLIYIVFFSLVLGCAEQEKPTEDATMTPTKTISGQVFYRERMLLPPGAMLKVSLEDVSKMDIASTVIATTSVIADGAPPYRFTIEYPLAAVDERHQYNLRATINLNKKLLFTSTEQLNPFRVSAAPIEIMVRKIAAEKLMQEKQDQRADTGLAVVSVNPLAELVNTYWKLLTVYQQSVTMAQQQPKEAFLQLANNELTVKGFAGCNNFLGNYVVKGNSLSFGPLAAAKKACLHSMDTENQFMQALAATRFYSIHQHGLTLLNKDKRAIAVLEAVYFN
jgi:putative lipoprotein